MIVHVDVVLDVLVIDVRVSYVGLELALARPLVHRVIRLRLLELEGVHSHAAPPGLHLLIIELFVFLYDQQKPLHDRVQVRLEFVAVEDLKFDP